MSTRIVDPCRRHQKYAKKIRLTDSNGNNKIPVLSRICIDSVWLTNSLQAMYVYCHGTFDLMILRLMWYAFFDINGSKLPKKSKLTDSAGQDKIYVLCLYLLRPFKK